MRRFYCGCYEKEGTVFLVCGNHVEDKIEDMKAEDAYLAIMEEKHKEER